MCYLLHVGNSWLNTFPEQYKVPALLLFLIGLSVLSIFVQWHIYLQEKAKLGLK